MLITYAALLGASALGTALAFGLGGRDVAARMLAGAYTNVQENKQQWRRDLDRGLTRAKDEAHSAKDDWSGDTSKTRTSVPPSMTGDYAAQDLG